MSRVRVVLLAASVLVLGFVFGSSPAVRTATASGSEQFEAAYYQGDEVTLLFPSHLSENPNLFTSGCLSIGPIDHWPDPTATLYNLFVPVRPTAARAPTAHFNMTTSSRQRPATPTTTALGMSSV